MFQSCHCRWYRAITGLFLALCIATFADATPRRPLAPGGLKSSASPVADAVMNGAQGLVEELLQQGGDVNAAQGDGMTALHWAALGNDEQTAEMLVYAGANLEATTRNGGYSPLFLASKNGNAEMVSSLLDAGANPNVTTDTGATPLMVAAASGTLAAVEALVARGAHVDAMEKHRGQTPLMFAAAYDRAHVIRALTVAGADFSLATQIIDVPELEKKSRAALRAKLTKQREDRIAVLEAEAKKNEDSQDPASGERLGGAPPSQGPAAGNSGPGRPETEKKRGLLAKLFGWMKPGSGDRNSKPAAPPFRRVSHGTLVGKQGGMTPLLFAARQGHRDAVGALLEAGADINQVSVASRTSPLLIATMNGHFDLARKLVDLGADPTLANVPAGVTPLYAAINVWYAPHTSYPQPTAHKQQRTSHLSLMQALLRAGADPRVRLAQKIWFSAYNFDQSGINETGATPFWRAAYGSDVDAMQLLLRYGADPTVRTKKPPERPRVADQNARQIQDISKLAPIPVGGPAIAAIHAATGAGYGEGFAGNEHRNHPAGWMPAVKFLVEECAADVNAVDHEGNSPLHNAAARGDVDMIRYLVDEGADVTAVNREGQTTADMANGPVQRIQPFPEALDLLVSLGAQNNNKCVSC